MFIERIWLQNALSFSDKSAFLELRPLNVLIGANGSGKSNLIECLAMFQAMPKNLAAVIGSVGDFLWKGASVTEAKLELHLQPESGDIALKHSLTLGERGGRLELLDESIENTEKVSPKNPDVFFYYRYQKGAPVLNMPDLDASAGVQQRRLRALKRDDLIPDQSILAQRKDPDHYPELAYLEARYSGMKIYREWQLGRAGVVRKAQKTDLPRLFLEEDASNLALVISHINTHYAGVRKRLLELLGELDEGIIGFSVDIVGSNEIQLFLSYKGLERPVPATRFSDGTLRYLCLLAILCHPAPPAVVCIEEPETGLHPDIIPIIAELLKDASTRCQLFVTTHSAVLVDALSDTPDSVIVCEKHDGASTLRRLDPDKMAVWLDEYRLGQLWTMGELGGTRW